MQSGEAELLFLRWGMHGGGMGYKPPPVVPFWQLLQAGDRSRAVEVDHDYAKADEEAGQVESPAARVRLHSGASRRS